MGDSPYTVPGSVKPPAKPSAGKPSWVPQADWNFILSVTGGNVIGANLIAAIGLHETQWGSVGVGRTYIFGYGVPATGAKLTQYSGFETQVRAVWSKIERFWGAGGPKSDVQPGEIFRFMTQSWKPGDQNWWQGVYNAYLRTSSDTGAAGTAPNATSSSGDNTFHKQKIGSNMVDSSAQTGNAWRIETPVGQISIPLPDWARLPAPAVLAGLVVGVGMIWFGGMVLSSSFAAPKITIGDGEK